MPAALCSNLCVIKCSLCYLVLLPRKSFNNHICYKNLKGLLQQDCKSHPCMNGVQAVSFLLLMLSDFPARVGQVGQVGLCCWLLASPAGELLMFARGKQVFHLTFFFFFIVYPFQLVFIDLEQIHPPVTSSHAASDLTSCCETTLSFLLLSCFSKRPCHTLGVQQPDEEEMKSMASTPHRSHVYSVSTYSEMNTVQRELISQVCAGVDDQLNFLASRGEGEMKHAAQT